jgi:hypothetical protein
MDIVEWTRLLFTVGGSVAVLYRPVAALPARRHLRCIDARLACPRSGADVDCTLVCDGRSGVYTKVESCSARGEGAKPACDQDCVRILNLGIPLKPKVLADHAEPIPHERREQRS